MYLFVAHLDRVMYVLGYIPKENRLYLGDKELNIVSFSLLLSVLEYQTAVMRKDFDTADKVTQLLSSVCKADILCTNIIFLCFVGL